MTDERIQRVTMPKWGLSMKTGKITDWLVEEGDTVSYGIDLAEVETEKIAGTLESTYDGVLRAIVADVGTDAPVGGTIAVVAPGEVPAEEIDEVVSAAREALASGDVEEPAGPVTGTVEVAGSAISYATAGADREAVVLVHGYGGDKNSWLFVQEPLAAGGRTVHALDLPGHGASDKDVGDGSLDTLARTVTGFLEALDVGDAHLAGHSLGGAVVLAAAAAAPERARSVTLVAPAGFGSQINADYLRGFADATSRRELKPHLGTLFADEKLVTRQLTEDLLKYKRLDGVDAALHTLLGTLLDGAQQAIDATPMLASVRVPVSVVWGREDRVLPPENADVIGDGASVRRVDGAGHMVHMEAPSFVREVIEQTTKRG